MYGCRVCLENAHGLQTGPGLCSALTLRRLPSRTPQTKDGTRATSGSERTTPYSSSISLFTRALLPSKCLRRLLVSIYRNKLKTQRSSHSSFSFAAAFVLSSNPRTTRRRFSTEMRAPASDACAPSSRSPAASTAVRNPSFSPYLYTYTHGGRVATYRVFTTIARRLNLSLPLLSRSPFVLYLFFFFGMSQPTRFSVVSPSVYRGSTRGRSALRVRSSFHSVPSRSAWSLCVVFRRETSL